MDDDIISEDRCMTTEELAGFVDRFNEITGPSVSITRGNHTEILHENGTILHMWHSEYRPEG